MDQSKIDGLKQNLRGAVIEPRDEEYDAARRLYNEMIFRDVTWSMVITGIDPDPANAEKISTWAKNYWNVLRPHKRRYDPTNLFRVNQNIRPS